MRRQQFFLQPADRQNLPAKGNFASHCHVRTHRDLRQGRHQGRAHAYACARAIFGGSPLWHVDMHVALLVEVCRDTQAAGPAAHYSEGGGDGFDHHVAQRTGLDQLALARHHSRLDGQQFAAYLRPRQTGHLTDLILLLSQAIAELAHAQQCFKRRRTHGYRKLLGVGMLFDHLAADFGNLAFEPTHTGFASVVANNVANRLDLDLQLTLFQAVGLDLLGRKVLDGDVDLFVFGVARQTNHFHPVQQRWGNVHGVRGAQEHYVGQVVIDFKVVVVEVVVLFGVENFQQRRCRIATHVAAHLVDLVEQEQRVAHTDLGHLLNQSPWHRADVGTPMTTNFGFITYTAQGHAHELAVRGTSNRLGKRGLAHAGRPYQAEHRAANFFHALLHGEVFKDAFLDLFKAVVIGVEDFFGTGKVQTHFGLGLPWHLDEPVDVGPHHGSFGRHRRHLLELVQLGIGLGQGVFRKAGSIDALSQLFDFVMTFFVVAELFLNGLHLLIQVVLALTALHLLLDATADTFFDLQQVDFAVEQGQDVLDPGGQIDDFEDFLLLFDLQRHVRSHGVYQAAGLIDAVEG